MTLSIFVRPQAKSEWTEAADWYDARDPGRGALFTHAVDAALDHIAEWPELHPLVFEDVRCFVMADHPYSIYYTLEVSHILVISVFHQRRDPSIWQERRRY